MRSEARTGKAPRTKARSDKSNFHEDHCSVSFANSGKFFPLTWNHESLRCVSKTRGSNKGGISIGLIGARPYSWVKKKDDRMFQAVAIKLQGITFAGVYLNPKLGA